MKVPLTATKVFVLSVPLFSKTPSIVRVLSPTNTVFPSGISRVLSEAIVISSVSVTPL